jgi:hypothetical protein
MRIYQNKLKSQAPTSYSTTTTCPKPSNTDWCSTKPIPWINKYIEYILSIQSSQKEQSIPTYSETATDTNAPTNAISFEFTQTHDAMWMIACKFTFYSITNAQRSSRSWDVMPSSWPWHIISLFMSDDDTHVDHQVYYVSSSYY